MQYTTVAWGQRSTIQERIKKRYANQVRRGSLFNSTEVVNQDKRNEPIESIDRLSIDARFLAKLVFTVGRHASTYCSE